MTDREPPRASGHGRLVAITILVALLILAAGFWFAVLPRLSVARQPPSRLEVGIATFLLHHSAPSEARDAVNPLRARPDAAALTAGRDLYTSKCETCHAFDGGGRSEIGANVFPRAPVLREAVSDMSDGDLFYHIRNGIRRPARVGIFQTSSCGSWSPIYAPCRGLPHARSRIWSRSSRAPSMARPM